MRGSTCILTGGDKGIRRKRPGRFRNSEECELVHFSERLRSTNRALHCAFRGHFVSDLLAMKLHSMSANATRLRLSSFVISPQGVVLQGNTTMKSWESPIPHKKISYKCTIFLWWRQGDSNPWPFECHSNALPTAPCPHGF